jgi:hypothetical protein
MSGNSGWIDLLGRHAVEGAGVFDLQIIAAMLANGGQDGIDTLSLASPPLADVQFVGYYEPDE